MMNPARRAVAGVAIALVAVGCTGGDASETGSEQAPVTVEAETVPTTDVSGDDEAGQGADEPTDRTLPEGGDPDTLGPLGETEVELTTDEGNVQIGSADVPDQVPESFPIPDDLVVRLASETDEAAGFSGSTALDFDAVVVFYEEGLEAAGYEVEQRQFIDGTVAVFAFSGPEGRGDVAISSTPGGPGQDVLVTFRR